MEPSQVTNAVAGTAVGSGAAWVVAVAALLAIGFLLFYWRRSRARTLSQRLQRP